MNDIFCTKHSRSLWRASLLGVFVALVCSAYTTRAYAVKRGQDGFVKRGATWGRFGLGLGSRTVTNTATGERETALLVRTGLGLSYGLHPRLAADFDTDATWDLSNPRVDQVALIPGARFFLHPQFYARSAYQALLLAPNDNHLFLLGAGGYLRSESASLFLELNAVAWSRDPVDTQIIPRAGVELAF